MKICRARLLESRYIRYSDSDDGRRELRISCVEMQVRRIEVFGGECYSLTDLSELQFSLLLKNPSFPDGCILFEVEEGRLLVLDERVFSTFYKEVEE